MLLFLPFSSFKAFLHNFWVQTVLSLNSYFGLNHFEFRPMRKTFESWLYSSRKGLISITQCSFNPFLIPRTNPNLVHRLCVVLFCAMHRHRAYEQEQLHHYGHRVDYSSWRKEKALLFFHSTSAYHERTSNLCFSASS